MALVEGIELGRQMILDGRLEDIKLLVTTHRLAVNSDIFGVLPIHLAAGAHKNGKKITHFLIKMGSDINARTKTGRLTPLHISVYRRNYEVSKLLVVNGANPLLRDEDNRDCFAVAKRLRDDYSSKILRGFDVSNEMTEMSDSSEGDKCDDDINSLVDQFEATLAYSFSQPNQDADATSVMSDDSFVTAVGVEAYRPRFMCNTQQPFDEFLDRYPLELQLTFQGRFTQQELQFLDSEFSAIFRATNKPFGQAKRTPLGMRLASGRVYFNYFLFDPRAFPQLAPPLVGYDSERISLYSFLKALFYIGKGVKNRPCQHLEDAKAVLNGKTNGKTVKSPTGLLAKSPPSRKPSAKIERVLDCWSSGRGVVTLHVFNNQGEIEAFTREACCIDAISLQNLTNLRRGDKTGPICTSWPDWKRRKYGAWLVMRAYNILRMESPPELLPTDFK